MKRVIFAKCSTERREPYQLITTIIEDENGRVVQKRAENQTSIPHLMNMFTEKKELECRYHTKGVEFNYCKKVDDMTLEFEYVEGNSFTKEVEKSIKDSDEEHLYKLLALLKSVIYDVDGVQAFEVTAEYKEIFGSEGLFLTGSEAASGVNFDMIMDNLIFPGEKIVVLDYEWIFDFPIPLNYILFRALFFCAAIDMMPLESKKEIYQFVGLSLEDKDRYIAMERQFQRYVTPTAMVDLHQWMGKPYYRLDEDVAIETCSRFSVLQGDGKLVWSELFTEPNYEAECNVEDADVVWIQPCEETCMVQFKELLGIRMDGIEENAWPEEDNGVYVSASLFCFLDVPRIKIGTKGYKTLRIKLHLIKMHKKEICQMVELYKSRDRLHSILNRRAWHIVEKWDEIRAKLNRKRS